jgi:membrane-associated phospholipid phosphatase
MRTMIRRGDSFSKHIPGHLSGLLLLLFGGLTGLVLAGATSNLDRRIARAIVRADHRSLDLLLGWTTEASLPLVLSLALPVAWSLLHRRPRFALLVVGSGLGSIALNLALKLALRHNPPGGGLGRPIDWQSSPFSIAGQISDSYSYPSGHVATTIVSLGLWLLWLWPLVPRRARVAMTVSALGFLTTLAYSRVYLGHHVATDILGGLLIGGAWLAGTVWVNGEKGEVEREKGLILHSATLRSE